MQKAEQSEENLLMRALKDEERGITQAELTRRLGWTTKAGSKSPLTAAPKHGTINAWHVYCCTPSTAMTLYFA
jgi:hypothetical protein